MNEPKTADPTAAATGAPRLNGRIELGSSCTIREAVALKAQLLEQIERPTPIEIHGAAVERVDAAGLQLLLAFALDCLERNLAYVWTGQSLKLAQSIELAGIGSMLDSPGVSSFAKVG
jgi:anti-anti-sigma regulatory factor